MLRVVLPACAPTRQREEHEKFCSRATEREGDERFSVVVVVCKHVSEFSVTQKSCSGQSRVVDLKAFSRWTGRCCSGGKLIKLPRAQAINHEAVFS
jgi:hypothetical protein